eukprot:m.226898 g.226898  ORF g.226898 m.226898 type:complete len:93 (+) comp18809_c0_seq2:245-523(+)
MPMATATTPAMMVLLRQPAGFAHQPPEGDHTYLGKLYLEPPPMLAGCLDFCTVANSIQKVSKAVSFSTFQWKNGMMRVGRCIAHTEESGARV